MVMTRALKRAGLLLALTLLPLPPALHAMGSLPTGPSERSSNTEIVGATIMSDMLPAHVRLLTDREFQAVLETEIAAARSEVVLALHLFSVSEDRDDHPRAIADLLAETARRGVQVITILEIGKEVSPITRANREAAAYLQDRGVKVYSDMTGTTVHAKLAVIDRRLVFLGSHDLSQPSLANYREATLAVDSEALATAVLRFIESFDPVPYSKP